MFWPEKCWERYPILGQTTLKYGKESAFLTTSVGLVSIRLHPRWEKLKDFYLSGGLSSPRHAAAPRLSLSQLMHGVRYGYLLFPCATLIAKWRRRWSETTCVRDEIKRLLLPRDEKSATQMGFFLLAVQSVSALRQPHTPVWQACHARSAADVTTVYGCYNSTGHGIQCAAGQPTLDLTAKAQHATLYKPATSVVT